MPTFSSDRPRGHKFFPDSVAQRIPPLYTHERKGLDAPVGVKFFGVGRVTYFITEFDGDDTLYGYCVSPHGPLNDEWGYSSLRELAELAHPTYPGHPALERDLHFATGITVAQALSQR